MGNIKYQKLIRKYSDDGGLSWNILYDNGKPVYQVGNIIESPSNCTSPDTYRLEWFIVPGAYICEGYNKYEIYVERESYDGKVWINTGKRRKGNLIEENSEDCGYIPPKNNVLEFEFTGTTAQTYKINNKIYTATTSPVRVDIEKDLGIQEFTSGKEMFRQYDEKGEWIESNITNIISIPDSSKVTDMSKMFSTMSSNYDIIPHIDVSKLDTHNVQNMSEMFADIVTVGYLDLASFNTEKVTDMSKMFAYAQGLSSLDLTSFNTEKVTDMSKMFWLCNELEELNLTSFNTQNVRNLSGMFLACSKIKSLDLSNFDTRNVEDFSSMFGAHKHLINYYYTCFNLTTLDLSNFNTEKGKNFSYLFEGASNLTTLDLSNWKINERAITTDMFRVCKHLTTIYANNCDCITQYKINNALLQSHIPDGQVTIHSNISCDKNNILEFEFTGDTATYKINNKIYTATTSPVRVDIEKDLGIQNFTSANHMFSESTSNILLIPDTSKVTDMSYMYSNNKNLLEIDTATLKTKLVTNMEGMFENCQSLTSLDLSNFKTSQVANMSKLLQGCRELEKLYLLKWNVKENTLTTDMFKYNNKLKDIYMFDCSELTINIIKNALKQSGIPENQVMFWIGENPLK